MSACTLVLALPRERICVGPKVALGFHQPTPRNETKFGGPPAGTPKFMRYDVLKRCYPTCG
ncbi:MAG: hypothetical protein ACRYGP_25655 [Janthinobacterium lividum]